MQERKRDLQVHEKIGESESKIEEETGKSLEGHQSLL